MASSPLYWSSEACSARAVRFGRFLVSWRKRCGWSQYELPKWADAAGFVGPAIGNISQLERGRVVTPTMGLFASLAEANRRLAARDFSGVTERRLLDRLESGVPVFDANGVPWGFQEFVSAMHLPSVVSGEIWEESGGNLHPAPELTDAELQRVNAELAAGFSEVQRTIRPLSRALRMASNAAPPSEREVYEDALATGGYEMEELKRLWDAEAGQWAPLVWLATLRQQIEVPAGRAQADS